MSRFLPPQISELFDLLADAARDERKRILDGAGLDDQQRAVLIAMLEADARSDAVLDVPAEELIRHIDADLPDATALVGRAIGPYTILALIGQGGSSLVFRARRKAGEIDQTVALKLLNSRWLSPDARRRFTREQYILSQLEHPGIARFIDGGVSAGGVPYLCMEYVEGIHLTRHIDIHRLDLDRRLRLAEELSRAVEAAHRLLIVHGDLKPSNVLVTDEGRIKVLDFGTARLLGNEDGLTQTSGMQLTPGYAAPEQYRTGPLTTAVDVYALGVITAELLTGLRLGPDAAPPDPDDAPDRYDMQAHVSWCDLDPDLQRILRAALASDPAQRYRSAGYFADDIVRFLNKEPLHVHPPPTCYRLRKFVSRNRAAAALAAAFVVCVAAVLGVTLWEARQAKIELQRANAMRDFMFDAFSEAEPSVPRAKPATILEVVERAVGQTRNDQTLSAEVRTELLTRLGTIVENQGKLDKATEILSWNANEAARTLGADDPLAMDAERGLADDLFLRGNYSAARTHVDKLLARSVVLRDGIYIRVLSLSGSVAIKEHDLKRAKKDAGEALERARELKDAEVLRLALQDYGDVLLSVDDTAGGLAVFEELLTITRERFGPHSAKLAGVNAQLARAYRRSGDLDAAERSVRSALAIDDEIDGGADDWRKARHLNALAMLLKQRRDFRGALDAALEGLRIDRATLGDTQSDTLADLNNVGMLHVLMENYGSAKGPLHEAYEDTVLQFGAEHWQTAFARVNYGYVLARTGDVDAGDAEMEHACATLNAMPQPDFDTCATARERQVRLFLDLGQNTKAMNLVERLDDQLNRIHDPDSYWIGRAATLRGAALLAEGHDADAQQNLSQARDALQRADKAEPVLVAENLLLLATAEQRTPVLGRSELHTEQARKLLDVMTFPPRAMVRMSAELN